jgi:phage gpG-like protein
MALDDEHIKGADKLVAILNELNQFIENDIPVIIGVEAVNHFKQSFINDGFTDTSLTKWASRKSKRTGGTNSQPILTKSGELGDSIDYKVQGQTVLIYTDKKYAQIHNEGGKITVTPNMRKYFWAQYYMAKEAGESELMQQYKAMALAKEIKIEKRQFIGESAVLNSNITDKILRELTAICNS